MPINDAGRVRGLVAAYVGQQPLPADLSTEPMAVRCGTAVVYLRLVHSDPTLLRAFSPLLRRVEQSSELLVALNDINARLNFLRLFWREGTVYASAELLAETLSATELAHACDAVADAADYYDVRLHARFGGDIAYAESGPSVGDH